MCRTSLDPALVQAYRRTRYSAGLDGEAIVLMVDVPSPVMAAAIAAAGAPGAAFITAENPYSTPSAAQNNAASQALLKSELAALGATVFEGVGQGDDPNWPGEASYLAVGISRDQACLLGRNYQQNAIVWIGANGTPELVLLR
jgi:hypothetical protein